MTYPLDTGPADAPKYKNDGVNPVPGGCRACGHQFDGKHAIIATGRVLVDGGIILCAECDCARWWSIEGIGCPPKVVLGGEQIAALRARVQAGATF